MAEAAAGPEEAAAAHLAQLSATLDAVRCFVSPPPLYRSVAKSEMSTQPNKVGRTSRVRVLIPIALNTGRWRTPQKAPQ